MRSSEEANRPQCDFSRWVFVQNYEAGPSGKRAERYKARVVGKGFLQTEDVDFSETYASVDKLTSIRMILSNTAERDLLLHQMAVQTAFLIGEVEGKMYMEQPASFK